MKFRALSNFWMRPLRLSATKRCRPHPARDLGTREFLNAVIPSIGDEAVPASIDRYARRGVELAVPAAWAAPFGDEGPHVREFLDAVVHNVPDQDVPARIDGDASRIGVELPVPVARAAPLRQERPVAHEF